MGFLDSPRRYLPARKVYADCDVCGCHTLLLHPCSHWHCTNCGYDTRWSEYKVDKLKREYSEVRKLNKEAQQKQYDLERRKLVSGWVKCTDCRYRIKSHVNKGEWECNLPTHYAVRNNDIEIDFIPDNHYPNGERMIFVACLYGKL